MTRALIKKNNHTQIPPGETPSGPRKEQAFPEPSAKQIERVLGTLEELWGQERASEEDNHHLDDPLDGLILTVLSQNTNDRNRDRGFAGLKARFTSWDKTAEASREDLAEAIRPAGIANNKARSILAILEVIGARFGTYSLRELAEWEPRQARCFLENLPGVGPKTAACVLVFDLDMPAFPADTHVTRVCKRLGWAPVTFAPTQIQDLMERLVSPQRYKGAHLNLIEHGRHLCKARNPVCYKCPVLAMCKYGLSLQEAKVND